MQAWRLRACARPADGSADRVAAEAVRRDYVGLNATDVRGDADWDLNGVSRDGDVDQALLGAAAAPAATADRGRAAGRRAEGVSAEVPGRDYVGLDAADVGGHRDRDLNGVVRQVDIDQSVLLRGRRCDRHTECERAGGH